MLEQRAHGRRKRGRVRRDRLAVTAVDQVHFVDLDPARRLRDVAEDRVEVLEHEHVHRAPAAVTPRRRHRVERLRHRVAVGRDLSRLPGREQLAHLGLDLGRDRDLRLQAQLLELAARLLEVELRLGAGLQPGGLGAVDLGVRLGVDLGLDLAELVLLALHGGLRVRHRDLATCACGGFGLLGLSRRIGLGDLGGPQDLGDPLAADALEVVAVVGDVLDLEHVELEPELLEIRPRRLLEVTRELQPILVELLGRHRREHTAEVTLERLLGDARDLVLILAEEALDRVTDEPSIRRHLDVRDRVHVERNAALGVRALHRDRHRDQRHVHAVDGLDDRHAHAASAEHDAIADVAAVGRLVLASGEDQDLVRPADSQQVAIDDHEQQQDGDTAAYATDDLGRNSMMHLCLPFVDRIEPTLHLVLGDEQRAALAFCDDHHRRSGR